MRRTVTMFGLALALPLAAACSDDGPIAPEDGLGIEGIVENEVVAATDLADLSDEERAAVREGEMTASEGRSLVRRKGAETRAAVCGVLTPEQASGIVFCRAR